MPSLPRLPISRWSSEWRKPGAWRSDLLAGLTGAVVVLPQGVAFATLAGMPAAYGLYAAMVPCVVAALWGSSRLMVTGPANAISLTTLALIAPLAAAGSADYIRLVITLSFLVGVLQLALGLLRVGRLVEHVPHSVVVGFTTGAAVLIINSQLPTVAALDLPSGLSVWQTLSGVGRDFDLVQWHSVLTGAVTLALAFAARPWNLWVPSMLVAVVGGSVFAWLVPVWWPQAMPLRAVDSVPQALPPLSWPDLSLGTLQQLAVPALVMTLLALTEATAIARAVARRFGDTLDGNQEFIGQGLANVAGAFFSSYPASGSFNRSGVNVEAGARTPWSAVAAAAFLVLLLTMVAPLAQFLPLAVIAGLLFAVAWGLIDRAEIGRLWQGAAHDRLPLVITAVATITLSLEWAILLGMGCAFGLRAWQRSTNP